MSRGIYMGRKPNVRMDASPWSLAADAYEASWSGQMGLPDTSLSWLRETVTSQHTRALALDHALPSDAAPGTGDQQKLNTSTVRVFFVDRAPYK